MNKSPGLRLTQIPFGAFFLTTVVEANQSITLCPPVGSIHKGQGSPPK